MAILDRDFQDLRDKVNTLGQRQDEVVIPALNEIRHVVEKMAFVPIDVYTKNEERRNKEIADLKAQLAAAQPAIKFFNALNSRWTQILIGGLLVAAVVAIGSQFSKIGIVQ